MEESRGRRKELPINVAREGKKRTKTFLIVIVIDGPKDPPGVAAVESVINRGQISEGRLNNPPPTHDEKDISAIKSRWRLL